MATVILAEKPSQARAYIDAFQSSKKHNGYYEVSDASLPANTVVTYGFGHLVELAPPAQYDKKYQRWSLKNLPIFPAKYQFLVAKDKRQQFKIVQGLLKTADTIIVATDSDREGENIAWSIMVKANVDLKRKTIKRLWINSLEKEAIIAGFKQLRNGWDYYPSYLEARTRQISDWLVGMNASPLYSLQLRKNGISGVYAIGRVQTPTLYMVYERDLAIQNFKPEPYFELEAEISAEKQKFEAKLTPNQRFKDQASLMNFMQAHNVHNGRQDGVIKDVSKAIKTTASPRLFSLSSLQSAINKMYHASASATLAAVQALYEAKLLTYPRTDCNYITMQEFNYLVGNLNRYVGLVPNTVELSQTSPQKRYVDDSKVQQHHAIILTKTVPSPAKLQGLPRLQQRIYDLVLRTTLAMFALPYRYEESVIITTVGQADFKASGQVPLQLGWKVLFETQAKQTTASKTLPKVTVGQSVQADVMTPQKMTTPPKAFTEGTLITAMKTAGKTLDEAEAQTLKAVEGIGTEATRANIIDGLKKHGYLVTTKNWLHVSDQGKTLCQAVELEPLLTSPSMTAKWEMALQEIGEKRRTPANFINQIKKMIQKLLAEVPGQFENDANLRQQLQQQKKVQVKAPAKAVIGTCPRCKVGKITAKKGFYGCSRYSEGCKFTLPQRWAGKRLGVTAIKQLITVGQTRTIKGFKSKKTGKPFAAKLKLVADKLQFDFDH